MKQILVYSTKICPYCVAAKRLLDSLGLPYVEIDLSNNHELRQKLAEENQGYRTVPMIFIDQKFIGGYTELQKLVHHKKL